MSGLGRLEINGIGCVAFFYIKAKFKGNCKMVWNHFSKSVRFISGGYILLWVYIF